MVESNRSELEVLNILYCFNYSVWGIYEEVY